MTAKKIHTDSAGNVGEFRGQRLLSHGGQTAGFAANISRYTDAKFRCDRLDEFGNARRGKI